MTRIVDGISFSLFQPNVFTYLRDGCEIDGIGLCSGPEFFRRSICLEYAKISQQFGCDLMASPSRMDEARIYWLRDVDRVRYDIESETTPDHFKHLGFLSYWLRRRQTVAVSTVKRQFDEPEDKKIQQKFLIAINEYCAFVTCFKIALYFKYQPTIDNSENVSDHLSEKHLDTNYVFDVATLMKNKNLSPHSMYMILRSLLYDFSAPPQLGSADIVQLVSD